MISWRKSALGLRSKDGRFDIVSRLDGGFAVTDTHTGEVSKWSLQRHCKEWAQYRVDHPEAFNPLPQEETMAIPSNDTVRVTAILARYVPDRAQRLAFLAELQTVKGNKSYQDTLRALLEVVAKEDE